MAAGTIKWFNTEKGYGFITPETGGKDVFVHIKEFEKIGVLQPRDGQKIDYQVDNKDGKQFAVKLKLAS